MTIKITKLIKDSKKEILAINPFIGCLYCLESASGICHSCINEDQDVDFDECCTDDHEGVEFCENCNKEISETEHLHWGGICRECFRAFDEEGRKDYEESLYN